MTLLRVHSVMSPPPAPLTLESSAALSDLLVRDGLLRGLPVVDQGRLTGWVPPEAVFRLASLALAEPADLPRQAAGRRVSVRAMSASIPETLDPDAPLGEAAGRLASSGAGCIPVVRDGVLVGLLTETDVLRTAASVLGVLERPGPAPLVDWDRTLLGEPGAGGIPR